jgi:antitoxin component YwqK of YwqJK toxin-antitoxin module
MENIETIYAVTIRDKVNGKASFLTLDDFDGLKQMVRLEFHSEDHPAYISRYSNGKIREEKWYLDGQICRKDTLPAYTSYWPDGVKLEEQWATIDEKGDLISCYKKYSRNGKLIEMRNSINDVLEGKDALVKYDLEGKIIERVECKKGIVLNRYNADDN